MLAYYVLINKVISIKSLAFAVCILFYAMDLMNDHVLCCQTRERKEEVHSTE